jgi:hypothetical protein
MDSRHRATQNDLLITLKGIRTRPNPYTYSTRPLIDLQTLTDKLIVVAGKEIAAIALTLIRRKVKSAGEKIGKLLLSRRGVLQILDEHECAK